MSCLKCKSNACSCETSLCINPLIFMIKEAFSLIGTDGNSSLVNGYESILNDISKNQSYTHSGNIFDLSLALVAVLTKGISISNNTNLCCPDCNSGLYVVGSGQVMGSLLNVKDYVPKLCCVEHQSSLEVWQEFKDDWQNVYNNNEPKCCDTDFSDVMKLWTSSANSATANFYLNDLLIIGIFESSSFNTLSGLGILYNYLKTFHADFTAADYLNILGIIVHLGLVVECNNCSITISSIETFIESKLLFPYRQ